MKKKILVSLVLAFIMALGLVMPVMGVDASVPQYNIVDEVCCTDAEELDGLLGCACIHRTTIFTEIFYYGWVRVYVRTYTSCGRYFLGMEFLRYVWRRIGSAGWISKIVCIQCGRVIAY